MELLNLLESKIQILLEDNKSMKEENAKLQDELLEAKILVEETQALRSALADEKRLRDESGQRITLLLEKINAELN